MAATDRPDIIVAVDLGTTFTGVGWARPSPTHSLQSPLQIVSQWPGCSTRNEQKVPTSLVYRPNGSLSSWGYLCEDDNDGGAGGLAATSESRRKEFFKIFLDHATLLDAHRMGISAAPATTAEAQRLVVDYLREVYAHVKRMVELQTGLAANGAANGTASSGWAGMAVEFVFSVPTTWRSHEIINTFKATILSAGFGTEGPRHSATVELTESEAAAVACIKSTAVSFARGDVFLSVDAGGGTTDFALMQVVEAREPFPALQQVSQVDGVGIGSTLVDRSFLLLVMGRLKAFPDLKARLPPDCMERLVRSEKFKTMKHKFGESVYDREVYRLPMEGVGFDFSYPAAGIEAGRMSFTRAEIQGLFDPHIESMLVKIRQQLDWADTNNFANQVNYLILSGGLGSSAYVRERLQSNLISNAHPRGMAIRILQAPDPQLVVVKGLLLDRLQRLDSGYYPVLVRRKARASYGVVCKTRYNPEMHDAADARADPIDGLMYAMGQIDWLIKKGDLVDTTQPITSEFSQKIDPNSTIRTWDSLIMISHVDRDQLPRSTRGSNAKMLCTVKSDLTGVREAELEMRKQGKKFFGLRSRKFYVCNFEVRAFVAPADLRFELWFNGQRFSGNHEPIKVAWDAEGAGSTG